jgi:hypothetical protein
MYMRVCDVNRPVLLTRPTGSRPTLVQVKGQKLTKPLPRGSQRNIIAFVGKKCSGLAEVVQLRST